MVELLLTRGADIYAVRNINITMLHCAAAGGLRDVNAADEDGKTPRDHENYKEIIELLEQSDEEEGE